MKQTLKAGQYFALVAGFLYLILGFMGFIPSLVQVPAFAPDNVGLGVTNGYGDLLGLFPVNVIENATYISIGLLGLLASISLGSARLYSGAIAIVFAILAVFGIYPPTQSALGLAPIFGNDVWLHTATAAIAIYFGFLAKPNLAELAEESIPQNSAQADV